jgi:hypothetical protein
MRAVPLCLALLASLAAPVAPQPQVDTTVTLQGFLQQDQSAGTMVVLVPLPFEALGVRTFVLAVQGKTGRWSQLLTHYVEVQGRVSVVSGAGAVGLGIDIDHIKEMEPPGTVRHPVGHGFSVKTTVAAAVIPNRFAWVDSQGRPTGVNPFVSYTVSERKGTLQESPIFALLPTNELLCVRVNRLDTGWEWDTTTQARNATVRGLVLDRSGTYRDGVQLPKAAASMRGRYNVRIGICQLGEYEVAVGFQVQ